MKLGDHAHLISSTPFAVCCIMTFASFAFILASFPSGSKVLESSITASGWARTIHDYLNLFINALNFAVDCFYLVADAVSDP